MEVVNCLCFQNYYSTFILEKELNLYKNRVMKMRYTIGLFFLKGSVDQYLRYSTLKN